jgi:hypothetical protein
MISSKINTIVDILAGISFVICAYSGFYIRDWTFGLNMREIHIISGKILIALVILHLLLHWQFIKNIPQYFKSNKKSKR